jgi:hypothetical protein
MKFCRFMNAAPLSILDFGFWIDKNRRQEQSAVGRKESSSSCQLLLPPASYLFNPQSEIRIPQFPSFLAIRAAPPFPRSGNAARIAPEPRLP